MIESLPPAPSNHLQGELLKAEVERKGAYIHALVVWTTLTMLSPQSYVLVLPNLGVIHEHTYIFGYLGTNRAWKPSEWD